MSAKSRSGPEVTMLERIGLLVGGGALLVMTSAELAFMGWLFLRVT